MRNAPSDETMIRRLRSQLDNRDVGLRSYCAAGDGLTSNGNRFAFWPLEGIRWPRALRFRTGGTGEHVVVGLLAVTGVALITGTWAF